MHIARDENWKPTGVDKLHARADACAAFFHEVNAAYHEQESIGLRYCLTRDDVTHAKAVAHHAKQVWHAAHYAMLARRWGVPADEKAAIRLPLEPWERSLLTSAPPIVPLDPRNEPHAPGDFPVIVDGWSQPLVHFLRGRRELADRLADRDPTPTPSNAQRTFIEMSQPPEREPGDDDNEQPEPQETTT